MPTPVDHHAIAAGAKAPAKRLLAAAAWLAVRPAVARCRLYAAVLGRDDAVRLVGETAARWPGLWGLARRRAYYRAVLAHVGRDVHVGWGTVVTKADAQLHDRVYLGRNCGVGRVTILPGALIADGVQLLSGRHHHAARQTAPQAAAERSEAGGDSGGDSWDNAEGDAGSANPPRLRPPPTGTPVRFRPITLGPRCWIGAHAVVMADVADHATVAAGAVVTKPVQARQRVAGVPAKPLPTTPHRAAA